MRFSRIGTVLGLILVALVVGAGAAGARPAQERQTAHWKPVLTPATGALSGHHCRTRRDPVAPDPADV